jgi:hypothetical protein
VGAPGLGDGLLKGKPCDSYNIKEPQGDGLSHLRPPPKRRLSRAVPPLKYPQTPTYGPPEALPKGRGGKDSEHASEVGMERSGMSRSK